MRHALVLAMLAFGASPCVSHADPVAHITPSPLAACDLATLPSQVIELLGRDPFVGEAALEIRIAVVPHGARRAARVELVERGRVSGVRTLEATSCDELVSSIAVVLALALRDRDVATELPPGPVIDAVAPGRERSTRSAFATSISAAGGAAGNDWALSLAPGVRVRSGRASLGFELELRTPDDVDLVGGGSIRASTFGAMLTPCAHRGGLAACAVLAGGWTRGAGAALFDARVVYIPVLAAGMRAVWQPFTIGRVGVQARAEVRANANRAELLVDHMAVWSSRRVEGWLGIGLAAQIP